MRRPVSRTGYGEGTSALSGGTQALQQSLQQEKIATCEQHLCQGEHAADFDEVEEADLQIVLLEDRAGHHRAG